MSLRLVFVLCICAIFVATNANARDINFADETIDLELPSLAVAEGKSDEIIDLSVEQRNPLLQVAINILKAAFKWVATHCLKEAAQHCKQHWANPKALISCGGAFFKANKGRCALG